MCDPDPREPEDDDDDDDDPEVCDPPLLLLLDDDDDVCALLPPLELELEEPPVVFANAAAGTRETARRPARTGERIRPTQARNLPPRMPTISGCCM